MTAGRRMKGYAVKRLLLICGIALLLAPVASAAHSQPLGFFSNNENAFSSVISQQPGAVNPTSFVSRPDPWNWLPCAWDAGDKWTRQANLNSSVDGGATATDALCAYQDWAVRSVRTHFTAPSPDLLVSAVINGVATTAVPVWDKTYRAWVYALCVEVPAFQPGDPALTVIADSNGGVAVTTSIVLRVANPARQQAQKIVGFWGYAPGGC